MADLLASGALWVVQLLLDLLPDTFVPDWLGGAASQLTGVVQGLGALNWLVDVNGALIIMGLWLTCVEAYMIANFAIHSFQGLQNGLGRLLRMFGLGQGE